MGAEYDFSGWATYNDVRCSDGRTIRRDAFKGNDGQIVPLVWNHQHNDPFNVLGHALLKNHPQGVRTYFKFNDTEQGQNAKALVDHGDITALSIYANQLKQNGGDVLHGNIREVSLVLAGANPEAVIDSYVNHSDDSDEEGVIYLTPEICRLSHNDGGEIEDTKVEEEAAKESEEKEKKEEPKEELKEETKEAVNNETQENNKMGEESKELEHADSEKTVADVFESMTDEQKNVVYAIVGAALEDAGVDYNEEDEEVKHNVFDEEHDDNVNTLSHADMEEIFKDAKRLGSLRDAVLAHADGDDEEFVSLGYGIDHIDYLFPDAKSLNTPPDFIKREMDWVQKVMNSTHHTPFSRIKSMFADITEDDARAKGYLKGHQKKNEVFGLLKRTTDPQTIYKKQKLDRDDIIDITDFDVVAWLKAEMRMMLDEEIARAILVSDGRDASSDDHISEDHIRSIYHDADLYSVKVPVNVAANASADAKAKATIRAAIKSRKNYKGSGNPTFWTTEDVLTDMLLLEDMNGRIIYDSVDKLATAMRVSSIVTVPVMENLTRDNKPLLGIIVNLADYNIGADKGGAVNMFDDFDIDYNQQKYLIETRCSGALIKPYSALVLELNQAGSNASEPEEPADPNA
ncbi:MAG: phage major capsid protein [Clostridiales bacterium]|nr:phage major capsid protein [Clostridiales bacterium]